MSKEAKAGRDDRFLTISERMCEIQHVTEILFKSLNTQKPTAEQFNALLACVGELSQAFCDIADELKIEQVEFHSCLDMNLPAAYAAALKDSE